MDILEKIKKDYKARADELMTPINDIDIQINDLTSGIQATKERIAKFKADLAQAQDIQDKSIADKNSIQTLDEATDDTVIISMKIASLERALTTSLNNLDALKNNKLSLLQGRATSLRDLISDSYGPVQAKFISLIEQSHNLFILWGGLAERLAEDHGIKYGKTVAVQDPISPLSFGAWGPDLKGFIAGTGSWESDHLGTKTAK